MPDSLFILESTQSLEAKSLAERLNLSVSSERPHKKDKDRLWLEWIEDKKTNNRHLALCSSTNGPVYVDFISGKKAHRRQFGGGKGQPLVRAMGSAETGKQLHILDATAGLGGDSFVLASQGFKVQMLERSAIIASLLDDALQQATQNQAELDEDLKQVLNNLSLINADSAEYLLTQKPAVDVIYMDPMYPEKKKKAAVKKEMQALQRLVGPDIDSSQLLDSALQTATSRVVVKRPKGAEPVNSTINNIQPNTSISSPNTRYDIYVIDALRASGKL